MYFSKDACDGRNADEIARQKALEENSGRTLPTAKMLARQSQAYVVQRDSTNEKSVIAGYPFFGDRGQRYDLPRIKKRLFCASLECWRNIKYLCMCGGIFAMNFGKLKNYSVDGHNVVFEYEQQTTKIQVISPEVMRVFAGFEDLTQYSLHLQELY